MSDRIRISRRRVMQMGIAAPLIAMEARGASAKEREAAAITLAKVPFPPGKLDEFKRKAQTYCDTKKDNKKNCDNFGQVKFGEIIGVLWAYFTDAVDRGGARIPTEEAELSALLDKAYNARSLDGISGELVARRSKDWGDVYEHVTNYCAYRCGLHAAALAGQGNAITGDHYLVAFGQTSTEIKTLVLKIKRDGKDYEIKGGGC